MGEITGERKERSKTFNGVINVNMIREGTHGYCELIIVNEFYSKYLNTLYCSDPICYDLCEHE